MNQKIVTWGCHVCGEERPDRFISVYTKDVSEAHQLPPGTVKFNIRYCNDRLACKKGAVATDFKFFSTEKGDRHLFEDKKQPVPVPEGEQNGIH